MKSVYGDMISVQTNMWDNSGMTFVIRRNRDRFGIADHGCIARVMIKSDKLILFGSSAGISAMQRCICGKVERSK